MGVITGGVSTAHSSLEKIHKIISLFHTVPCCHEHTLRDVHGSIYKMATRTSLGGADYLCSLSAYARKLKDTRKINEKLIIPGSI